MRLVSKSCVLEVESPSPSCQPSGNLDQFGLSEPDRPATITDPEWLSGNNRADLAKSLKAYCQLPLDPSQTNCGSLLLAGLNLCPLSIHKIGQLTFSQPEGSSEKLTSPVIEPGESGGRVQSTHLSPAETKAGVLTLRKTNCGICQVKPDRTSDEVEVDLHWISGFQG